MYGSSTRQSLNWSLSSLVPNSAEVAHEDLLAPTRTAVDKHGWSGGGGRRSSISLGIWIDIQ
jgi:hypothetical protein